MGTTVQASTPLADLPIRGRRTYLSREVTRTEELEVLLAEWQDLAEHAAEPNVFYEPWMVLPALDAYGGDRDLRFLFLFEERRDGPPLLCGFFPIERVPHFRGLPIPRFRLWDYVHCFLGTPLVRAGRVRSVIAAFQGWLRDRSAEHFLLEMPYCAADGPVHGALVARAGAGVGRMVARSWERAHFERRSSGAAYLAEAMRTKKSKEARRLWRRLAERGRLEVEVLSPGTGAAASPETARTWGEEFLATGGRSSTGSTPTCGGCASIPGPPAPRRLAPRRSGQARRVRRPPAGAARSATPAAGAGGEPGRGLLTGAAGVCPYRSAVRAPGPDTAPVGELSPARTRWAARRPPAMQSGMPRPR